MTDDANAELMHDLAEDARREAEAEARLIAHQEAREGEGPSAEAEEEAYGRALEGQLRARGLAPD